MFKLFKNVFIALTIGAVISGSVLIPLPGATASTTIPVQTGAASDSEELRNFPAQTRLAWDGVDDDGTVNNVRGASLNLRVENLSPAAQQVELSLRADNGGTFNPKLDVGSVRLDGFGSVVIPVDVRRFGFVISSMLFSGRLQATARVLDDAGTYIETSLSSPVFFHPTSVNTTAFYGKQALQRQFSGGDFRGRARNDLVDREDSILTRVMDAGTGNASAESLREEQAKLAEDVNESRRPSTSAVASETDSFNLKAETQEATAANKYRTCILFRIQTTDSGRTIDNGSNKGGTEDYWTKADAGMDVPAHGVHVRIKKNGVEKTYVTDQSTGCFNWSHDETGEFLLTAYGYASDVSGTYVRIHNNVNDFSSYPGTTYRVAGYIKPSTAGTQYYAFGNYDSEWTAMAIAAFTLYRVPGAPNKAYHMAIDNTANAYSSAHWSKSNSYITSGRHYLRIANVDPNGGMPQAHQKSVVSHEMGHAIAALYYGAQPGAKNGGEPDVRIDHNVTPDNCVAANVPFDSYWIGSKEWNSVGFREGFATFLAARVWNNKDYEGALSWMGTQLDLERHSNGTGTTSGGRLENVCCTGPNCGNSLKSAGTNEDWVLFFWDLYTNKDDECTQQPSIWGMLNLYSGTRFRSGLAYNNYFGKMREAVMAVWPQSCLAEKRFDAYAIHNGINN
ncbi:MAG TPA: hypothetical protein PLK30_01260 [Blastocatellia bacterium]|nr:hypothetical protein [Blastocatellia bacterium]